MTVKIQSLLPDDSQMSNPPHHQPGASWKPYTHGLSGRWNGCAPYASRMTYPSTLNRAEIPALATIPRMLKLESSKVNRGLSNWSLIPDHASPTSTNGATVSGRNGTLSRPYSG